MFPLPRLAPYKAEILYNSAAVVCFLCAVLMFGVDWKLAVDIKS